MLIGTGNVAEMAARAPVMSDLHPEPFLLAEAEVLQVTYEVATAEHELTLPPALHPTDPPIVTWLFYRCPNSPWGPMAMAQTRIECRSGLRLRAFLLSAVVDNAAAAEALRTAWGYSTLAGEVLVQRHYDAIRGVVRAGGATILDVLASDPDPLSPGDVHYVPNMNLAETPQGRKLVQVEPKYDVRRAERGRPRVLAFDGAAWGERRVVPVYPVAASLTMGDIAFSGIRFVCRPDVWAFEGTEAVK
jgi:acetoacetate decarboxylase